jgi:translation initiation factor 2-alpha kinase 4
MGKKKKQSSKKRAAAAELAQEEAREELLALAAIYGEDIEVHEGHASLGFSLRVVPHPGEASANYVSVTLVVRSGSPPPGRPAFQRMVSVPSACCIALSCACAVT